MKYWIISLLLVLVTGAASAESLISSDLTDREQVGVLTNIRWTVRIEASNVNKCIVDLKILNSQGQVVQVDSMVFPMWDRSGVERQTKNISAFNEVAANWSKMDTTLTCY